MPRKSAPDAVRYQIREHTRITEGDGERHEYGAILWDQDDLTASLPDRSGAAIDRANELAEVDQRDIAVGIVSVTDPNGPFQAIYFTRPSAAPGVPELRVIAGGQRGSIVLDCLGMLAPIIACVVIAIMVLLSSLSSIGGPR